MEILIVEDDYISRSLLKKMLMEMGHQVVETENGLQAWELLQERHIQIIITDWMMPEMDGLELCRNIRGNSFPAYIYIIMLTAKDRKKDLVEVFRSGADDYIPKPFDPEELSARVLTGLRVIGLEERHRQMQGTLIESRNKLRIVIDALQEEIVTVSERMEIVTANRTFAQQVQYSVEELVGKSCLEMAQAKKTCYFHETVRPIIESVFDTGQSREVTCETQGQDGDPRIKQVACLPIKDNSDHVFQVLVVSKDMTEDRRKTEEIHQLNEQLTQSAAQLEIKNKRLETTLLRLEETQAQMLQSEKMASIGQLSAGVAHEINNPTGFVSSNLKTLDDYQKDIIRLVAAYRDFIAKIRSDVQAGAAFQTLREVLNSIADLEKEIDIDFLMEDIADLIRDCRQGTDRIKKIVMDLKDFAHPGNDTIQSTDINKGIESTLNVIHNEIKFKATVEKDLGDIPTVHGYPQQLNQVFMNILINAAQAIETQGKINIKTRREDGFVIVAISDTGCGIDPKHLGRIFDPFFTTKEVGKGTGLGMNIAYNIVKKHNGDISVDSQKGGGTTFTVRIPEEI
ncbi:MAG: response regulator [Desulfatitalea sp.]|nr:response regulator [Desulfatitalea sp.]NNK02559.1 response regulator [Desulfatitalea sp.]